MRRKPTSLHQKNSFLYIHPALALYNVVSIALLQTQFHLVLLELVFHVAALEVATLQDPPLRRDEALPDMELASHLRLLHKAVLVLWNGLRHQNEADTVLGTAQAHEARPWLHRMMMRMESSP